MKKNEFKFARLAVAEHRAKAARIFSISIILNKTRAMGFQRLGRVYGLTILLFGVGRAGLSSTDLAEAQTQLMMNEQQNEGISYIVYRHVCLLCSRICVILVVALI